MKVPAGELERLEHRQDLFHARNRCQRLALELALVSDDSDNRPHFPAAEVRFAA
jgi:hypothetical protein